LFGEQNGRAKLHDFEIPIIFQMRSTGMKLKEIGDHFGVSQAQISLILRGHSRLQK
jgi:transcriptional regulator